MAGKLKREADIVKNQVNDYLNATTAYSKYLNGEAPCYITYYQIIPEASREDYSLENVHSLVGTNSPIRYRKISNVPVYGIDRLAINNSFTERGIQSSINGTFVIVPSLKLRPVSGDFFVIEGNELEEHLFIVEDTQYDKATSQKYYQVSWKLHNESVAQIESNVIERCVVTENPNKSSGSGSLGDVNGDYLIVSEEEAANTEQLQKLVDGLIDKYIQLFYDEEMDMFVYTPVDTTGTGIHDHYFCPYVQHFLYETQALSKYTSDFMEEIYISDINEFDYPYIYSEDAYRSSLYEAVLKEDYRIVSFESSFASIGTFNLNEPQTLPFFTSSEHYRLVELNNPLPDPKNLMFWVDAFHIILGNEKETLSLVPKYKKFVDLSELEELDDCYEINAYDMLYKFDAGNELKPVNAYVVIPDATGQGEVVEAGLTSMFLNTSTDQFVGNRFFIFNIIRNYFNKTLSLTDTVMKNINGYYYKRTMENYLLMPIVIYILKSKIK